MSCFRIRWLYLSIILIGVLFCLPDFAMNRRLASAVERETVRIDVNPIVPLHYMRKEDIYTLRKANIDKYRQLKIYPEPYQPDPSIFGTVDEKAEWLKDAQFYVANPYLLVLVSGGNYTGAFISYSAIDYVEYESRIIYSRYKNQQAKQWLQWAFRYSDCSGIIRLWFVNARDAGFKYAHVDLSRSVNVRAASKTGDSVAESVYSAGDFFHLGRSQKNNISVNDPRAKLLIKNECERVVVYVKLWKNQPSNILAKEDLAYVVEVDPGDNEPQNPGGACREGY